MASNEIIIREEFDNPQGQFIGYDTFEQPQRVALEKQSHVDIRTIEDKPIITRIMMIHLDQVTMDDLNPNTVSALEQDVVIRRGEEWSHGTVAKEPTRNNWKSLTVTLTSGNTSIIDSVIPL